MNRTEAREKATALVAQMTIEEAASQLLHSSPRDSPSGHSRL